MLDCGYATVHDHDLAGDKRGIIRGEVQCHSRQLFRLADALKWRALLVLPAAGFLLPEELTEIGLNKARRDGIDADVMRAKLLRPRPRHHDQSRLGKAVEQPARLRPQPRDGSNVDDRTTS